MTSLDELPTEQPNARTADIDRLDTLGVLERLNDEDRRVATAVRACLPELGRAVDLTLERWRRGGRVVLFGAGTSGRLAILDAAELPPTFGVSNERYMAVMAGSGSAFSRATEGAEDVAFGIAASGRTPWVLGALEGAARLGALRLGLACVPHPELAEHVDVCIAVDTGPEAISGSTRMKAGTAQKLVLNAFSSTLMIRLGKVYSNLMIDVQATNEKLVRRAQRLVEQATGAGASEASAALEAADGQVKVAVAALRLGVPAEEAARRLEAAQGRLRVVLGEDRLT
jgi:N-acetylmuramic acid 6-phosphate etherase